jgi:hypothetical protein
MVVFDPKIILKISSSKPWIRIGSTSSIHPGIRIRNTGYEFDGRFIYLSLFRSADFEHKEQWGVT